MLVVINVCFGAVIFICACRQFFPLKVAEFHQMGKSFYYVDHLILVCRFVILAFLIWFRGQDLDSDFPVTGLLNTA